MPGWSNWSGRQRAEPARILAPGSIDEAVAAVRLAGTEGLPLRAVGASHSHSRVAATDGLLVDTDGLQGVRSTDGVDPDTGAPVVTVLAGTRIHQLGEPLWAAGLGLVNQGDIDKQSIAGATATGTHGTGRTLRNLSSSVVGVRVVTADGEIVHCDERTEPDLFAVARHSLGAVGLVVEVDLRVRERYRLTERLWTAPPDEVMPDIDRLLDETRHFEFFWVPDRDLCACKSLDEVAADPEEPIATDGATSPEPEVHSKRERTGWSHRIISSIRDDKHTEMEYAVPAENGPACFDELRTMIHRDFPDLAWPLEYRAVAADDLLISAANGRETVTISAHQDISLDDRDLFAACEEIFRRHDGRPHWGKVHDRTGQELAEINPGYRRWWELRDCYDPDGVFLTPYLEGLRP